MFAGQVKRGGAVEEQALHKVFTTDANHASIEHEQDGIWISRAELVKQHDLCVAEANRLRRLLNFPPLLTGKELRRLHK